MLSQKMIPYLWVRLVVTIAFGIFIAAQSMWLIAAIAAGLAGLTGYQLWTAYQHRENAAE